MESCLADTGQNIVLFGGVAITLIIVGALMLVKLGATRKGIGVSVIAFAVVSAHVLSPVSYAASGECTSAATNLSQPDTSTGVQGAVQTRNVLLNDTPTPGSEFISSSLRLALATSPVPGSALSANKRTVTAPTEGVYDALSAGLIRYTPEASFIGIAKGVRYSIKDTAGNITTNSYRPTVTSSTPSPTVCTETPFIDDALLSITAGTSVYTTKLDTITADLRSIDSTADGTTLVGVSYSNAFAYMSVDSGRNWRQILMDGNSYEYASMSDNGQVIVFSDADGLYKYSTNGGSSWSTGTAPNSETSEITVSNDGLRFVLTQMAAPDYNDSLIYTSTDAANWQLKRTVIDGYFLSTTVSNNGQVINALTLSSSDYSTSTLERTTNGGTSWTTQSLPSTNVRELVASQNGTNILYMTDGTGYLMLSTNGGSSFSQVAAAGQRGWLSITMSGDGQTMYAAEDSGDVYRSQNGGTTWTASGLPTDSSWYDSHVSTDASTVFISQSGYGTFAQAYSSTDAGASWVGVDLTYDMDRATIDLDTSTPGIQQTLSYDQDGTTWTMQYNPSSDTLTVTFTSDTSIYYDRLDIPYTASTLSGCSVSPMIRLLANNS